MTHRLPACFACAFLLATLPAVAATGSATGQQESPDREESVGTCEADASHMHRAGVVVRQDGDEPVEEVLVEQEPHAGT